MQQAKEAHKHYGVSVFGTAILMQLPWIWGTMFGNQHSATTLGNDAFGSTPRKDEDSDMERSGTSLDQIQTRYSKPRNWKSIQAKFSLSTTSETNPVPSTAIAALNMCLQGTYPTIHELLKILLVPTELISCIIHALIPTVTTVIDYCKFKEHHIFTSNLIYMII